MIGGKSQSAIRPVALGITVQSSTYGQTIPVIYGRTKTTPYLIWTANLRQTSSKSKKKKKSVNQYAQNVDFLIGHNPILGVLQFWANQNTRYPLNFAKSGGSPLFGNTITVEDQNFYAVIGLTSTESYNVTFNDYGSTGSRTLSGTYEAPWWNLAFVGPSPTRNINDVITTFGQPHVYRWNPSDGNVIWLPELVVVNVYYAQLNPNGSQAYNKKAAGTDVPAGALYLTFEPTLGDGPEFTGADSNTGQPLSAQRILYPHYAGLGSADFQSGQGGLPNINPEVQGAFGVYSTGDADFTEMIQDIFTSGLTQPGWDQNNGVSPIQHGLGCYEYPGPVQMWTGYNVEGAGYAMRFPIANTAGNFLLVASNPQGTGASVGDTAGNSYTAVVPGYLWYATARGAANNEVTVSPVTYGWQTTIAELAGVDTFDASATSTTHTCSVTTTNQPGYPAFLVAFVIGAAEPTVPLWNHLGGEGNPFLQYRIVYQPGTYTFTVPASAGTPSQMALVAFKATTPSATPRALGNILEPATLALTRAQCRANGLYGSLLMDSQQAASDYLETLFAAANAAPVWSGFRLKTIPYSEVSAAGNGAIYNAPTATGPVATLKISDFVANGDGSLYTTERKAQVDVPNLLQLQCPNRSSDYNDVTISQPETGSLALYGPRKDAAKQFRCIQDAAVARMILGILVRKQNYLRNTYKFTLNASWKLLEPMDLLTLPPDPVTGTPKIDVRLTSVEEDDQYQLACEAEPFLYGTYAPNPVTVTSAQPYQPALGTSAGHINPPLFFEPVPRLIGQQTQGQLWIVVSAAPGQIATVTVGSSGGSGYAAGDVLTIVEAGAAHGQVTVATVGSGGAVTAVTLSQAGRGYTPANNLATSGGTGSGAQIDITAIGGLYGGCFVYISTDGGNSYSQAGQIVGNGTTGVTTADWPAAADPDSTNNLLLDLSESGEPLDSYQVSDEDNFTYPCYVAGGTSCIPYELMTYAAAALTAANQYTLEATASGDHLRRAVFGAPTAGQGVDHPSGSRFAFLGPTGTQTEPGILKLNLDPRWIGQTLSFKFLSMNGFGGGVQSLSDVPAYSYTPTGVAQLANPNGATYVQTPAKALSNPSATSVAMTAVTVQFPSGAVKYNARTFTIAAPAVPTTYYVTIADPGFLGDVGTAATLTATCQASQSFVGLPGNTYIGSILALPAGGGTVIGPGGWPPQTQVQLIS